MKILFAHKSSQTYKNYPYHNHQYWEVVVNLTGKGDALIDGEPHFFDENTVFCIPPGIPHKKTAKKGFTDGNIFFTDFTPLGDMSQYVFQDDSIGSFHNLFDMAYQTCLLDELNTKGMMDALAELLNQLLLRRNESKRIFNKTAEDFQQILLQNIQNYEFDLSKAQEATGYSPSYFRKVFKDYTGMAPGAYLQKLRIDFAKRQMRQFQMTVSIQEIAEMSGFADPDYFSRVFKNREGISPREYIKSLDEMLVIPKISDTTPEMDLSLRRRFQGKTQDHSINFEQCRTDNS